LHELRKKRVIPDGRVVLRRRNHHRVLAIELAVEFQNEECSSGKRRKQTFTVLRRIRLLSWSPEDVLQQIVKIGGENSGKLYLS
jgi:hypothetical protein